MSEFDTLATIEVERHRKQMLYAERQLLKAGDYEAVTQSLLERSRKRLFGCSLATSVLLVQAILQRNLLQVGWGIAMLVVFAFDYSHAKRTHQTIQRLKAVGAQEDARPVVPEDVGVV
jgi:hypothetical protein